MPGSRRFQVVDGSSHPRRKWATMGLGAGPPGVVPHLATRWFELARPAAAIKCSPLMLPRRVLPRLAGRRQAYASFIKRRRKRCRRPVLVAQLGEMLHREAHWEDTVICHFAGGRRA